MKILYYYWMQYNDANKCAGGVQVYLNNIIAGLRQREDVQIITLSSGIAYNFKKKCYIEKLKSDGAIERYQVVNSPMLSPSKSSFHDQETYLHDTTLKDVLRDFLKEIGGVDVIHFQCLEGLALKVLELKEEFPQTKFILSLHNYQCFCPQVNLWKREQESCDDFHDGRDCPDCLGAYPGTEKFRKYYLADYYLRKVGMEQYSQPLRTKLKNVYGKLKSLKGSETAAPSMEATVSAAEAETFCHFRRDNVAYINRYMDAVLCVSERVKEIAMRMGVLEEKAMTSYIGSAFAEYQAREAAYPYHGGTLKIAYMGYMRKDKGFYFFLDVLATMPEKLAKDISLVIAARYDDPVALEKLQALRPRFAELSLYDGYTHKDIPAITRGLHLGIVPVLWEDNLPQVAIEFKAMGIPVLAADRGGASELSHSKKFVFKSGDKDDFIRKLEEFIRKPDTMQDYWKEQNHLITMKEHCDNLMQIYGEKVGDANS